MEPLTADLARRFPALGRWADVVRNRLAAGQGVLLGETGALSTFVHVLTDARPGTVRLVPHADAGQVFYGRRTPGEVLHLDVFHSLGDVDHRLVARRIREALDRCGAGRYADFVDVQTATGGGRITGSLRFGDRETLRRAHRNHVHVAMYLPWQRLDAVFFVLDAVERAIREAGCELRLVEGLERDDGRGSTELPLSDYAAVTDSLIPEGRDRRHPSGGAGAGTRPAEGSGDRTPAADIPHDQLRWTSVELAQRLESPQLAIELLRGMERSRLRRQLVQQLVSMGVEAAEVERALEDLLQGDFARADGGEIRLTDRGRVLLRFLETHPREIHMALRSAMQRLTRNRLWSQGRIPVPGMRREQAHSGRTRVARVPEPGQRLGELAWPETVLAAAARGRTPLRVSAGDLRVHVRQRRKPVDVCLLIDASASMSGERMRAAKTLARHLLFTTRDRVAVVVFQERQVRVSVPFTRNYARVEEGLATIRPFGLTPLATGLVRTRAYLEQARPRNPLLLLITDGIPTVPHEGKNPLEDALRAAAEWRATRAGFACVGLQPNERYLTELVTAAGGALYVVEELQAQTLVAIAARERLKRIGSAPHRLGPSWS